jgi:hypothetical protein
MILTNNIINVVVLILILVFYFFTVYQKVKLLYLFRSLQYHFTNLFFPYNADDLTISKISYINYFNGFFFVIINVVIALYLSSLRLNAGYDQLNLNHFNTSVYINLITVSIIVIRFLIIKYVLNMFIGSKLKLIFYKNFIISIIISLLMIFNFFIYTYNDFYDFNSLKISLILFISLFIILQTKNYLSYFVKLEVKEVMYFILYLCTFKLAPWIWLYSLGL